MTSENLSGLYGTRFDQVLHGEAKLFVPSR